LVEIGVVEAEELKGKCFMVGRGGGRETDVWEIVKSDGSVHQQFGAVCGNDFSIKSHSSTIRHGEYTLSDTIFTPAATSTNAATH
jgi:hypothetical protein